MSQLEFEFDAWHHLDCISPMPTPEKRPLTEDELTAIDCLEGVRMLPASWEKRFRRDVLSPARETKMLSEKAIAQLWRLLIKYRRQWSLENRMKRIQLLHYAQEHAAPDFRKQQAALREQKQIDQLKEKYARATTGVT